MKTTLRNLKAKLQRAGEAIDETPLCERCECPKCHRRRSMTSDEKRARFRELAEKAIRLEAARIADEAQEEARGDGEPS